MALGSGTFFEVVFYCTFDLLLVLFVLAGQIAGRLGPLVMTRLLLCLASPDNSVHRNGLSTRIRTFAGFELFFRAVVLLHFLGSPLVAGRRSLLGGWLGGIVVGIGLLPVSSSGLLRVGGGWRVGRSLSGLDDRAAPATVATGCFLRPGFRTLKMLVERGGASRLGLRETEVGKDRLDWGEAKDGIEFDVGHR